MKASPGQSVGRRFAVRHDTDRYFFRYSLTAPEAAPDATYGSASNVCAVAVEEPFWNDPSVSTIDALQGRAVVLHAIGTLDAAC